MATNESKVAGILADSFSDRAERARVLQRLASMIDDPATVRDIERLAMKTKLSDMRSDRYAFTKALLRAFLMI